MFVNIEELGVAIPKWVLKHKKKGTEIKVTKGKKGTYYYLYEVHSKWDSTKKRAVKISGKYLGKITKEHGLVTKGQPKKKKALTIDRIRVKEFGATSVMTALSQDIIDGLKECFPDEAETIFSLSLLRLLHQSPLKNMSDRYEESYLSHQYPNLNLSKDALTREMRIIGSQSKAELAFKNRFVSGAKYTLMDVTDIISQSQKMTLNHQGPSSKRHFDPQVSLLYLFSVDKRMPATYRILPGNISGVKALKLTIQEANLEDCTVVGDKGFTSEANLAELEKNGLYYVLPLKRNSSYARYSKLKYKGDYDKAYDGHFLYKGRPIFYYRYTHNNRKCIMFYDEQLGIEESKTYLNRMKDKYEGYTLEGFKEMQQRFGTFLVVTNRSYQSAEQVYQLYKSRMEIERLFGSFKNNLKADRSYMQSDESFKAWILINHIAALMYYKLLNLLKKSDLLSKYSPKDLIERLIAIKKIEINGEWYTGEINSKTEKILKALKLPIPQ